MTTPGRLAFVGSGEYLPVMQDIEAWLLEGRPRRYVQLATAAAPEGDRSLARWHQLGAEAAERLGVEQVVVDVRNRQDADDPGHAAAISGAGRALPVGGQPRAPRLDPARHARVVGDRGRVAGRGLAGRMQRGRHGARRIRSRHPASPTGRHGRARRCPGPAGTPALRQVQPHDPTSPCARSSPPMLSSWGIHEDTALVADGPSEDGLWEFRSRGRQSCWRIDADRKHRVNAPLRLRVNG